MNIITDVLKLNRIVKSKSQVQNVQSAAAFVTCVLHDFIMWQQKTSSPINCFTEHLFCLKKTKMFHINTKHW